MKIAFYTTGRGKSPVRDSIAKLPVKDRARIIACLKSIEELGFDSPRVQFRQIKGSLWEIKIKTQRVGWDCGYFM